MNTIDYSSRGQKHEAAALLYEQLWDSFSNYNIKTRQATAGYEVPVYTDAVGAQWKLQHEPFLFLHNLHPQKAAMDPVGTQFYLSRVAIYGMSHYEVRETTTVQTQVVAAGGWQEKPLTPGFTVRSSQKVELLHDGSIHGQIEGLDAAVDIDGIQLPAGTITGDSHREITGMWIAHIPKILEVLG